MRGPCWTGPGSGRVDPRPPVRSPLPDLRTPRSPVRGAGPNLEEPCASVRASVRPVPSVRATIRGPNIRSKSQREADPSRGTPPGKSPEPDQRVSDALGTNHYILWLPTHYILCALTTPLRSRRRRDANATAAAPRGELCSGEPLPGYLLPHVDPLAGKVANALSGPQARNPAPPCGPPARACGPSTPRFAPSDESSHFKCELSQASDQRKR